MGKKTFAMLIVAVVALFAGYNMYQSQRNVVALSELALANMEALAGDEHPGNNCHMNPNNWVCKGFPPGVGCYCNLYPNP